MRLPYCLPGWVVLPVSLMLLAGCTPPPAAPPGAEAPQGPWNLPGRPPYLAIHYMPWFQVEKSAADGARTWSHWRWEGPGPRHDPNHLRPDGLRDIASVYYPLIGPYNSWDPRVIRYHLATARAAGVSIIFVIWYGPGSYEDQQMPVILDEAARLKMRVAVCYEEKLNFPPYREPATRPDIVQSVSADLTYIITRYGSHPAYLCRAGKPFIYQFNSWGVGRIGPRYLVPDEWKEILAHLPRPIVFGRQNLEPAYYPPVEAAYIWWTPDPAATDQFAQAARALCDQHRLAFFMSMIAPGFDDTGVWGWGRGPRVNPRHGLQTLQTTLDHALVGDPEIVQIVTWNDFAEGTVVEPTVQDEFAPLATIGAWWAHQQGRSFDPAALQEPFAEYVRGLSTEEHAELPAKAR